VKFYCALCMAEGQRRRAVLLPDEGVPLCVTHRAKIRARAADAACFAPIIIGPGADPVRLLALDAARRLAAGLKPVSLID
jgi:hypothetical protein